MKIALLTLVTAVSFSAVAQAAVSFTGTITETFTGYDGNDAPANWTVSAGENFRGYGTGSGTSGGVYSFGTDTTGTDTNRWLGFQFAADPSDLVTFTFSLENDTGTAINALKLSYDGFQFRLVNGGRSSLFQVNINGGSTIADLQFLASTSGTTGAQSPIEPTTYTAVVTGLNILPGETFTINFVGNRGSGSGASQGLGIDNVTVTAVPEPHEFAIATGGLLLAVVAMRRRRKV